MTGFSPAETLQRIQQRLDQHSEPLAVITEFAPRTLTDAIRWARLRPAWDEYRRQHSEQAIGIAAVVSRRAIKEFRLTFGDDGRVRPYRPENQSWQTPEPALRFTLEVLGQPIRVEYTIDYFPTGGTDLFYFVSPNDPVQAHPLSETGCKSQFAPHDAVEACGGPEAFARLFAEACLAGRDKEFIEPFEGKRADIKIPPRGKVRTFQAPAREEQPPVLGDHTALALGEEEEASHEPPRQGLLF